MFIKSKSGGGKRVMMSPRGCWDPLFLLGKKLKRDFESVFCYKNTVGHSI